MQVEARVVGRSGEPAPRTIPWDDAPAEASLRTLVEHVVRAEVAAFVARQRDRRFLRVLTEEQIAEGAAAGQVRAEVREATEPPAAETAVATALEAIEDGIVLVFVDDVEVDDLDATVTVRPDLPVRFVRLVPLAGGA